MTWKPVAIKSEAHSSDVIIKKLVDISVICILIVDKGTGKDFR